MKKFETYNCDYDGCYLQTSGVLFEADSPEEAIRRYRSGELTFWNSWRGSFWGVLQDRTNDITLFSTTT